MYKVLNIGGKEYKLEYTIEASLYGNCTESLMTFFGKTLGATQEQEITKGLADDQKALARKELLMNSIKGISDLPDTTLTLFYAGLMEHHGEDGDGTVLSRKDAKKIVKQYLMEHDDGENKASFYDLLTVILEQMGEDGFFKRTGLEKMFNNPSTEGRRKVRKIPQDHKKASTE